MTLNRNYLSSFLLIALMATPALAQTKKKETPKQPLVEARLIVEDAGGMFSPEAIKKAKSVLSEIKDVQSREMDIITFKGIPESKKIAFEKLKADERSKWFSEWAFDEAKTSKAKGVFVFICRSPGHIVVLVDKALRDKGFTATDEQRIRDVLAEKFRESTKIEKEDEKQTLRDKGLLNATEFVRDAYKKMVR